MSHIRPLPTADVVVRHGIVCTSLARTVFDTVRTLSMEAAVALADAAERAMTLRQREWDTPARESWRNGMQERLSCSAGARGIRQARWVLDFADGRAQLPGESLSRLQLARIGFRAVQLQVPVPDPWGGRYWVDFGLNDADAFGEFDGKDKYVDQDLTGKTIEQVLLAEKEREDWIRGTTGRRFARWNSTHLKTPTALAARLASFHIRP